MKKQSQIDTLWPQ